MIINVGTGDAPELGGGRDRSNGSASTVAKCRHTAGCQGHVALPDFSTSASPLAHVHPREEFRASPRSVDRVGAFMVRCGVFDVAGSEYRKPLFGPVNMAIDYGPSSRVVTFLPCSVFIALFLGASYADL